MIDFSIGKSLSVINYIEEVFVKSRRKMQYLWRAVDRDGEVVDVFVRLCHGCLNQSKLDGSAAFEA